MKQFKTISIQFHIFKYLKIYENSNIIFNKHLTKLRRIKHIIVPDIFLLNLQNKPM